MNSKLKVSVNKNPTKEGVKVQFVLPQALEGDKKAEATQKLQSKLNQGLGQYNLTVSQDTDVPYSNVIGFLIPIADIKLLIKNAIGGGSSEEPASEEAPTEEPVKEVKRMQKLAGILGEAMDSIKNPLYVKFNLINKNTGDIVASQGNSLSSVEEFKSRMAKFKESLPSEYYEDLENTNGINYGIQIKLIKAQIGSISKEQEDFLDYIAGSTGAQYDLFY
jgi:hypothetical protein